MSFVFIIYSRTSFKEYLLPAIQDSTYNLKIEKELFGLNNDLDLPMESRDGVWYIRKPVGMVISKRIEDENKGLRKEPYKKEALRDSDLLHIELPKKDWIALLVKETDRVFSVYRKYRLSGSGEFSIGSDERQDHAFCYTNSKKVKLVSGRHAVVKWNGNVFTIEDTDSTNGTFINGRIIAKNQPIPVQYGDCLDIFGFRILFLPPMIAVSVEMDNLLIREEKLQQYEFQIEKNHDYLPVRQEKELFHRSPRNIPKIDTEKIEIEAPPAPREIMRQSLLLTIGPSLTMALPMIAGCLLSVYATKIEGGSSNLFMYTGLVTALGSALIGTAWGIVGMRQARAKGEEDEKRRSEAYRDYLKVRTEMIQEKYERNARSLREMYPDAIHCIHYDRRSVELWNRNFRHEDFLCERVGLGALPFQASIEIPKERFTLVDDSLADQPKQIREKYQYLQDVPVCVDFLEHKLVGIIGGKGRKGCYTVMNDLAAQIAANNCYTDVKMMFIYDESKDAGRPVWEFARWLPHVWSEDKKTRFVAGNKADASDVFYEVAQVLRMRAEENEGAGNAKAQLAKPYYILFLENVALLEGELISKYIYDTEGDYGISTVVMVESYEDLPNACEYIIENTETYQGIYNVDAGEEDRMHIQFDALESHRMEEFARRLSSIEVKEEETGGEIPNVLTFFDLYGVNHPSELNVAERWKKARTYESMRASIGQKSGSADCYLDIHEKYHGPHGLVAGTTGSGKSETLQTYMLSLAVNYSPDDIGFFVIDYKGGGMANLFEGLPHLIGQISNLSGNQVRRAMVSIKSENRRRQRIFNEHGVNNINLYTRLYKNKEATEPIPHMFIIIDEFAELKKEEPEFMKELISVAQVGRSLGVHLILATQKPSGTVDDNIWSNSKFRLCLRVQDKQDSMDMLHRPDAAYITQAGRCYIQVGNDELFELFQSAWSGAIYDKESGSVQTNIARMLTTSGRAALVGSHAQIQQKERIKQAWIGTLLDNLHHALRNVGCTVQDCLHDRSIRIQLLDEMFLLLAKNGIDYVDTDYNRHRMLVMLQVYGELLQQEEPVKSEELPEMVISLALRTRKKLPEIREKTQLDAVIEHIADVARENSFTNNLQLWLPVLPDHLYLDELEGYAVHAFDGKKWQTMDSGYSMEVIVGLVDDPENQSQVPLSIDVAEDGNHAIVGTVVSGKSTFLLTYVYSLIQRYTPDMVNVYLIDYSAKMLGLLEDAPQIGGVLYEGDTEKVSKLFTLLDRMLEERKRVFRGMGYGQYVHANGLVYPSVIVVIDNIASFRSKTNGDFDDLLIRILQEGVNYGMYVIATAAGFGMNEIPNRMGENFRSVVCLEMNDKYAYTEALRTMHIDIMPEENVKGRGIIKMGDAILEFQTALILDAEDEYKRTEMIREQCRLLDSTWTGHRAKRIPEIPDKPTWSAFIEMQDAISMAEDGVHMPIGYDKKDASVYGIDLSRTYCYMVSGKQMTGKSNTLRILMMAARQVGGKLAVVDFAGDMSYAAQIVQAEYIDTPKKLDQYFKDITPTFLERNAIKKEYEAKGRSSEELYERMQSFDKLFIFIWDLVGFVAEADNPGEDMESLTQFVTNLWEKGSYHNVFWFAAVNPDDRMKGMGYDSFKQFIHYGNGIHLGGRVDDQQILSFEHIPYNRRSKAYKPGIGLLPTHDEDATTTVVLPLYRME